MRRISGTTMLILKSVLAIMLLSHVASSAEAVQDYVADELVCQVTPEYSIDSINAQFGTSVDQYLPQLDAYLLATQPGADVEALSAEISALPQVVYCDPNYILDAPEPVQLSEPFLDLIGVGDFQNQTASQTLQLGDAHGMSTGASVKVGVVDVGVNFDHPLLSSTAVSGFDYVDGDSVAADDPGGAGSGHGTFVAGVVNLVAPDAELRSYRVLDTAGSGNGFTIAEALLQAMADGCKVINLSMVMLGKHGTLDKAIEYAKNNDVLVVAAAGNDSSEVGLFPAEDSYTLSVAALDSTNRKADFSNFGGKVDICAPGTNIYAPFLDTLYAWWDGTSFAAPFVAGQAALLWAAHPTATRNQIIDAITETAINIDAENPEYVGKLGAGLIDPVAALTALASFTCGDIDADGSEPNVADLSYLVSYLFLDGPPPLHPAAANVDGDCSFDCVTVADLSYLVDYLFLAGPPPVCGGSMPGR